MARLVSLDPNGSGVVLELGAGTGPVTAALVRRGVPQSRLWIVERMPHMASELSDRYPDAHVLCCSADDVAHRLPDAPVAYVVSSLPFRSLPPDLCVSIMDEIDRVLAPGGLYIQFTYALIGALPYVPPSFEPYQTSYTVLNIPPAKVAVFRKPL